MVDDAIAQMLTRINPSRLSANLFQLSKDPLPYRKLNYTLPGHRKSTLHEADGFILRQLVSSGYWPRKEGVRVQAYRCDESKPKAHQHGRPDPRDPWYTAYNLYGTRRGTECPDEIVVICAHKDSQSWVDSPGAYDNAVGTAALMEIARVLADHPLRRSLWFLFCNEEHTPWTSVTAAQTAKARGHDIIAVFNTDSLGGKSQADVDAGRKTNATLYTTSEGKRLADLMCRVNRRYSIGLEQSIYQRKQPGDDDGSFVNAGFPDAIVNVGSHPYADPNYHSETDVPELVDIPNVTMATQAILAAALTVDLDGKAD
jgi:hypothetical protein